MSVSSKNENGSESHARTRQFPGRIEGYLNFNEALSHGLLSGELRELISVVWLRQMAVILPLRPHGKLGKDGIEGKTFWPAGVQFWRSEDRCSDAFSRNLVVAPAGKVDQAEIGSTSSGWLPTAKSAEDHHDVGLNTFTNYY